MTPTKPSRRRCAALAIVFTTLGSGCDKIQDLPVGKGFSAKYLCSYVFNSDVDADTARSQFIVPKVQPLPLIWDVAVDADNQMVTVADKVFLNENLKAKAIYREGMGCTLLVDKNQDDIAADTITPTNGPVLPADQAWPIGTAGIDQSGLPNLDNVALEQAIDSAFIEVNEEAPLNTTSLLVAHKGKLIAERYGFGITPHTPVLGWSMTKTVAATLIGIAQDRGLINIDDPAPFAQWEGTEKATITTRHILNMASGLEYNEGYAQKSDATTMLYENSDQVAYTLARPLINEPGSTFNYSTGDANLLSKIVHDASGGTTQSAYDFYQSALFHPIGINSAFIEVDASGQFVGGAYGFMSPRDWLRMGQLYLQKGEWQGEQVVSSAWIDFIIEPSPAADFYGGQIWLNPGQKRWPNLPEDVFHFQGHQGQRVIVIPSHDIVVVRTGVTEDNRYLRTILDPTIAQIIDIIEEGS